MADEPNMADKQYQAHIEVYKRDDNLFDWRMVAANGDTMCGTDQGFTKRVHAHKSVAAVMFQFQLSPGIDIMDLQ